MQLECTKSRTGSRRKGACAHSMSPNSASRSLSLRSSASARSALKASASARLSAARRPSRSSSPLRSQCPTTESQKRRSPCGAPPTQVQRFAVRPYPTIALMTKLEPVILTVLKIFAHQGLSVELTARRVIPASIRTPQARRTGRACASGQHPRYLESLSPARSPVLCPLPAAGRCCSHPETAIARADSDRPKTT